VSKAEAFLNHPRVDAEQDQNLIQLCHAVLNLNEFVYID
jgi:hypothetical protein